MPCAPSKRSDNIKLVGPTLMYNHEQITYNQIFTITSFYSSTFSSSSSSHTSFSFSAASVSSEKHYHHSNLSNVRCSCGTNALTLHLLSLAFNESTTRTAPPKQRRPHQNRDGPTKIETAPSGWVKTIFDYTSSSHKPFLNGSGSSS